VEGGGVDKVAWGCVRVGFFVFVFVFCSMESVSRGMG